MQMKHINGYFEVVTENRVSCKHYMILTRGLPADVLAEWLERLLSVLDGPSSKPARYGVFFFVIHFFLINSVVTFGFLLK